MKKPLPGILPEEAAPAAVQRCRQCELSRHGTRVIWGEGNNAAPLFVILDNPGAREDKNGVPFLCGTRETMQAAAYEAGIMPGSMYISYILKCRPRKSYDKTRSRAICISHLWKQLENASPQIIICLGDVVCQSFFENPEMSVKQLRGRMHKVKNYDVVCSYHPLAVRRRPALYQYFLQDWRLAASRLK